MKFSASLYYFCFSVLSVFAFAEDSADRFPGEDYIPFYVEIVQDYEVGTETLKKGSRAVVIRPVSATQLRVSVARTGTFTLPATVTNVHEEIACLQNSDDPNLRIVPRMSFFLANRIVSGESGWLNPIRYETLNASSRWFLLYGDASDDATTESVIAASKFYDALEPAERANTTFVYMDIPGNKKAITKLADTTQPSIQCMPGYLSKGYVESLDHIDRNQVFPQLVEVASSGRIIRHINGSDAICAWLQGDHNAE